MDLPGRVEELFYGLHSVNFSSRFRLKLQNDFFTGGRSNYKSHHIEYSILKSNLRARTNRELSPGTVALN
ncbi:MAG: hypothetical protein COR54_16835 [Elusimicrobia bacterium CG22_combo_CG10-13_8_21_14_all_63_91]|nr:MAG: hypothetical protein COR54_16835 [Elusimicrobia bacterium CG22_combo_CG10-13_8_21_14_all_63_91]